MKFRGCDTRVVEFVVPMVSRLMLSVLGPVAILLRTLLCDFVPLSPTPLPVSAFL